MCVTSTTLVGVEEFSKAANVKTKFFTQGSSVYQLIDPVHTNVTSITNIANVALNRLHALHFTT